MYDVALIRQRARSFREAFSKNGIKAQVSFASKAFSSVAMVQLADEEGLSLDVVSGGGTVHGDCSRVSDGRFIFMAIIKAEKNYRWH